MALGHFLLSKVASSLKEIIRTIFNDIALYRTIFNYTQERLDAVMALGFFCFLI